MQHSYLFSKSLRHVMCDMIMTIYWRFLMLSQKLLAVIGELESLKPEFHRQVDELKKANDSSQYQIESTDVTPYASISPLEWPHVSSKSSLSFEKKLVKKQFSIYVTHYPRILAIFKS